MTDQQVWPFVVTFVGLVGFWLGGKKIWWSWWINVANQILWVLLALATQQWGFLIGVPFYLVTFLRNALLWTRDRHQSPHQTLGPGATATFIYRGHPVEFVVTDFTTSVGAPTVIRLEDKTSFVERHTFYGRD